MVNDPGPRPGPPPDPLPGSSPSRGWLTRGQPPARPIVIAAIVISVASIAAGWAGDAFLAGLVDKRPLLLMLLSPRNRNLILVTNQLSAVTYFVAGFLRLVATDPVNYLLGFWFGDKMLAWVKRRSRTYGPLVEQGSDGFRKYAGILIFAAPNNIVSILAGATGVKARTFAFLNISGTIVRLIAVRQLGETLESPISGVIDFIGRYRTPILILSILMVLWTIFGEFRGDNSELSTLRSLADADANADADNGPQTEDANETEAGKTEAGKTEAGETIEKGTANGDSSPRD